MMRQWEPSLLFMRWLLEECDDYFTFRSTDPDGYVIEVYWE